MLEYLRIALGLTCLAVAAGAVLVLVYFVLAAGAHARQHVRGTDFLGPFVFVAPSFYDEGGRGKRISQNILLSLAVFIGFAAFAILIGEAGR
jgi:hypothetical protein